MGPRVAAACAHACLAELSEADGVAASRNNAQMDGSGYFLFSHFALNFHVFLLSLLVSA